MEHAFIDDVLKECVIFSKHIVVVYGSAFYDGTPEDLEYIKSKIIQYEHMPNIIFSMYEVNSKLVNREVENSLTRKGAYWHNMARIHGVRVLNANKWRDDFILFLDADEIPDGVKVKDLIDNTRLNSRNTFLMTNYWYFREPIYQATTLCESGPAILSSHYVDDMSDSNLFNIFMNNLERHELPHVVNHVMYKGEPIFHHYSWVRTKDEMLKKVNLWAHKHDRDWITQIENEFTHEFNGTDFVHGYSYRKVGARPHLLLRPPK